MKNQRNKAFLSVLAATLFIGTAGSGQSMEEEGFEELPRRILEAPLEELASKTNFPLKQEEYQNSDLLGSLNSLACFSQYSGGLIKFSRRTEGPDLTQSIEEEFRELPEGSDEEMTKISMENFLKASKRKFEEEAIRSNMRNVLREITYKRNLAKDAKIRGEEDDEMPDRITL